MSRRYSSKSPFEEFIWKICILAVGYIFLIALTKQQGLPVPSLSIPPWFLALFILFFEIALVYYFYQQYRLRKAGIDEIDKMTGEQFEEKLVVLFHQLGYSVNHYSKDHHSNEFGVDLIIEKDGYKTAVQAKRYSIKEHVNNTDVEKLFAGKAIVNCDKMLVVTTSTYTEPARTAAIKLGVELWDRNMLISKLLEAASKTANT